MKKQKKDPLYKSFGYAFAGIFAVVTKERNMKIHCVALEMVNTAVEAVVDLVTKERRPLAKLAKDAAAGAVLIVAIMAAIAGMIIFIPKLLESLSI